eukprot:TRINITY_DN6034_c0_g1_i1.p1 TRINITY_DN6034_c0_g1~~TRINITY_DN6034_c0_g1_i1.p1  ORF type:complete len:106 (+),score=5.64 TRINITY_DN6034_c0_g1_i1:66-383(+)
MCIRDRPGCYFQTSSSLNIPSLIIENLLSTIRSMCKSEKLWQDRRKCQHENVEEQETKTQSFTNMRTKSEKAKQAEESEKKLELRKGNNEQLSGSQHPNRELRNL